MARYYFTLLFCCWFGSSIAQNTRVTDVLVIGGGTGGTAAGIQSARSGARTMIIESGPWLGGMISAAGVSAIDGNHKLPSGIWAEFRSKLYAIYGDPKSVETGWVSNTLFEPHVADSIFKAMAGREKNLSVLYGYKFEGIKKAGGKLSAATFKHELTGEVLTVKAAVFVDATELGDVMKAAGAAYDLGMEADRVSGEKAGIIQTNDVVQDLTYVAILKDYGKGTDRTIVKPANYDPAEFDASNTDFYKDKTRKAPSVDSKRMLDYGKLPYQKYMINWPIYGNDTYLNVVEMTEAQRQKELVKAKQTTLRFIYFIQQQLGFKNLGLADDEFPTADGLALMPYHREGRRVQGLVRFTMRHMEEPFTYGDPLYRTGIAVGDYPIDHHHKKNPDAPQHLEFYPVPSYTIPLGALIPQSTDNLIIAEKGISVSNVANGATRLQPVVLLTGQAAGVLAALSSLNAVSPRLVPVRSVQQHLLDAKAYILPYIDLSPANPHFEAVQKIGVTSILKGTGVPYKWANQTWFYPDSLVDAKTFEKDLCDFQDVAYRSSSRQLTIYDALRFVQELKKTVYGIKKQGLTKNTHELQAYLKKKWAVWGFQNFDPGRAITRLELAVLLDNTIDPFSMKAVNHKGAFTLSANKYSSTNKLLTH